MPWRLVLRLDDRVLRLPLEGGDLRLGSAEDSDLRVPHYTVSRRHALLHATPERVALTDLGSSNGTLVDGRRIGGRVELSADAAVAFGSVEGTLEAVADAELESAVRVGEGGAAATRRGAGPGPGDARATTFSLGSIKAFTLRHLPDLLERALDGAAVRELAPAVGSALSESLPASAVEIAGAGGAILFRAGEPGAPGDPHGPGGAAWREREVPGTDLAVRVAFLSADQASGYESLVEAGARLLGLAGRAPAPRRRRPDRPALPAPPDPPSLDPEVRRIYADAARIAPGDVTVLVCGESGTGKEVLARFLHAASGRPAESLVALNCAALPRDLLEAELFGVEEGAATGVSARPGKFELAHGGTLFLDEIGDMAPATQAKILRALQEGEVYRIGGRSPRPARARVVSATNRDLDALLAEGGLRSDLYHRIADWRVELPPLRHRRADVPNLAAHFLEREVRRRGLGSAGISRAAMDVLAAADWPGNIRQLEREIARIALFLEEGELVETRHLHESVRRGQAADDGTGTLEAALRETERREIRRALARTGGDTRAAARMLGIGRSTLYRKMDALGVEPSTA